MQEAQAKEEEMKLYCITDKVLEQLGAEKDDLPIRAVQDKGKEITEDMLAHAVIKHKDYGLGFYPNIIKSLMQMMGRETPK